MTTHTITNFLASKLLALFEARKFSINRTWCLLLWFWQAPWPPEVPQRFLQAHKTPSDKETRPWEDTAPPCQKKVQIWTMINPEANGFEKVRNVRKGKQAELCDVQTPPGKLLGFSTWAPPPQMRLTKPRRRLGKCHDQTWTTNTGSDSPLHHQMHRAKQMRICSAHLPGTTWTGLLCLSVLPALVTPNNTSYPQNVLWENDAARPSSTTTGTGKKYPRKNKL